MDYSLINKYLSGTASEEEVDALFRWVEASSENKQEFFQYKKVWVMTARSGGDREKLWDRMLAERIRTRSRYRILYRSVKYAAVVLLFFGLGFFVRSILPEKPEKSLFPADMQIAVPPGQMSDVTLPDGTTVQLNSGSRLIYPGSFYSGNREVTLEGEAFFDVAKDKSCPFLVKTRFLNFKVYGTSFNVQAYPEDQEINTTLVEGSLGVIDKKGRELTRLVPGENVKFRDDTNELQVSQVRVDLYTSWKEGLITFRNESLREIARKIERWYNVEIVIKNEKLAAEPYMGTLMKNKPIDQILEVFRLTSSLNYRIVQRPDQPTLIYWE